MKYRYLGSSGLLVSRICLGTMTFGMKDWGCDQAAATQITNRFIEAGGNFIDTADIYCQGLSEEMLGQAIQDQSRDDLVLATKCWFRMGSTPNAKGLSRKHIVEALEASLRRLQTDFVDLYQLHGFDPHTPLDETLRAIDDLVRAGKIRYAGCSNFYAWQLVKANAIAEQNAQTRFVSGQYLYNLLRRDIEREILPACHDQGMGLMCWSPLAGGMLTGKYSREDGPPADSRVGIRKDVDLPRYWNDDSFQMIEEVLAVAREAEKSPVEVALSWLLHDRRVAAAIVGARKLDQLNDSLGAGDWDLPDGLHERLASVVPMQLGYPADWIAVSDGNTTGHEE